MDDYGDYGSEGDAFDKAMQDAEGFDNFADDGPDAANTEEERFIGHLVSHPNINKREHIAVLIKQALKNVGA